MTDSLSLQLKEGGGEHPVNQSLGSSHKLEVSEELKLVIIFCHPCVGERGSIAVEKGFNETLKQITFNGMVSYYCFVAVRM